MNIRKIGTLFTALFLMSAGAANAQDLIARQAPIDRKLKSIDSLALKRQVEKETAEFAAVNLYPSWDNNNVHVYGKLKAPDNFRIDLRGFAMPTDNRRITSVYGPRRRRQHKGLDIKVYVGDTIRAAFDGKVRIVKYERAGYGKYVVLRHPNGLETIYGHMSAWLVEPNDEVKAGQPIGLGGNTGRSSGSHLHFETRLLGTAIDPELLFDFPNQDVTGDFYVYNPTSRKTSATEAVAQEGNTESTTDSGAPYHKVRKGDSLYKISKERGITIEKLCKLNGLTKRSKLRIGQVLRCS